MKYLLTLLVAVALAGEAQAQYASGLWTNGLASVRSGTNVVNEIWRGTNALYAPPATYQVTTTNTTTASTNTITLAFSAPTQIDWGDGTVETKSNTNNVAITHVYAATGTYTVAILQPLNVRTFNSSDAKVTLHSANVKGMRFVTDFRLTTAKAGTFNSSDVSAWRPTSFYMSSMPTGYAGTFDSSDVSAWRPTSFYMYLMPAGYAGTFNSTDVSAWRPTIFALYSMPTGYVHTIAANSYTNFITCNNFRMEANALTTAQVDLILQDLYVAAKSRTATAGTINVGGSNQAPSGTLQACAAPPVTNTTPGKEVAYELVNDSLNAIINHWTTVTITP